LHDVQNSMRASHTFDESFGGCAYSDGMRGVHRTEFIGTFLLVCLIGFATTIRVPGFGGLAVGLGLTGLIYMGGHVSWAQYNPAVSLAFWLRGEQPLARTLALIITQFAAAIAAATMMHLVMPETWSFLVLPPEVMNKHLGAAMMAEFVFTFMMVLVIMNVAKHPATSGNGFYAVAIGLTVASGAILGGTISGGAFNPSVTLGPLVVQAFAGIFPHRLDLDGTWIAGFSMVATQLVAAGAAAIFSRGQLPRSK
jgi:aquaporin Z